MKKGFHNINIFSLIFFFYPVTLSVVLNSVHFRQCLPYAS